MHGSVEEQVYEVVDGDVGRRNMRIGIGRKKGTNVCVCVCVYASMHDCFFAS